MKDEVVLAMAVLVLVDVSMAVVEPFCSVRLRFDHRSLILRSVGPWSL